MSDLPVREGERAPATVAPTNGDTPGVVAASTEPRRSRRRPLDVKLLLASLGIAVCVVAIGWAFLSADTGDDDEYPAGIESVDPVPDSVQVLAQSQVVVDLAEGYVGRLAIDGIDFDTVRLDEVASAGIEPGAQVDLPPGVVFEPGNDTLTFVPGEDSPIERFEPGPHEATVVYWDEQEGPGRARSFTWTFDVI